MLVYFTLKATYFLIIIIIKNKQTNHKMKFSALAIIAASTLSGAEAAKLHTLERAEARA